MRQQQSVSGCFPLESLNADFCKRISKDRHTAELTIANDFSGLCSYLTAPNIRNKIRHPLFLTLRFNSCISLYYNRFRFTTDNVLSVFSSSSIPSFRTFKVP